jgi:hypothetical protein
MVGSALASKLKTFAKREVPPLSEHVRMTLLQERRKRIIASAEARKVRVDGVPAAEAAQLVEGSATLCL